MQMDVHKTLYRFYTPNKMPHVTRPVTRGAQGGEAPPRKILPPLEKCVGHSSNYWTRYKNVGPSQKTFRPSLCPRLVTGLHVTVTITKNASLAAITRYIRITTIHTVRYLQVFNAGHFFSSKHCHDL